MTYTPKPIPQTQFQYKNSSNLEARIRIHQQYSTNRNDWFLWVFDHFHSLHNLVILELGSGSGKLWIRNINRIPVDWKIFLSDISPGILNDTICKIPSNVADFHYQIISAQDIPFPSEFFDVIIANHMLYHVPDRRKAFLEIRRTLKPDGKLYASTVGEKHMEEMFFHGIKLIPNLFDLLYLNFNTKSFTLENGAEQMKPYFSKIELDQYPDSLKINEPEPIIDYILSLVDQNEEKISSNEIIKFNQYLKNIIRNSGCISIKKSTGIFTASKSDIY